MGIVESGQVEMFPNDALAGQWLHGFMKGLREECRGVREDLGRATLLSGANPALVLIRISNHLLRSSPPLLEGYEDAQEALAGSCAEAERLLTHSLAIMMRNATLECPVPADRTAFLRMLNPVVRAAFDLDSDGLSAAQRAHRVRLTPAVERYLRTRQFGQLSDEEFAAVSRRVATLLVGSGLPSDQIDQFLETGPDGEQHFVLFKVSMVGSNMVPNERNPFQPPPTVEEQVDQFIVDLWTDIIGSTTTAVDNLLDRTRFTEECTGLELIRVANRVGEALPTELERAFSMSAVRWSPPDPGRTTTIAGRVVSVETGEPLGGIRVEVHRTSNTGADAGIAPPVETDPDGRFEFREVEVPQFPDSVLARFPGQLDNGLVFLQARGGPYNGWSGGIRATVEPGEPSSVTIAVTCNVTGRRYDVCRGDPRRGPVGTYEIANADEVAAAIERLHPPALKAQGISPSVLVGLRADQAGQVDEVMVLHGSGYREVDEAALEVARMMRLEVTSYWDRDWTFWVQERIDFGPQPERPVGPSQETPVEAEGFERNPVSELAPPPSSPSDSSDAPDPGQPTFTPHTVGPRPEDPDQLAALLDRYYPPLLKDQGVGGTVELWVHIDETGTVTGTRVATSSGSAPLDQAAQEVMSRVVFTPAKNRDTVVAVWIKLPVTFGAPRAV